MMFITTWPANSFIWNQFAIQEGLLLIQFKETYRHLINSATMIINAERGGVESAYADLIAVYNFFSV